MAQIEILDFWMKDAQPLPVSVISMYTLLILQEA
jgi:hypothetical protein